MLLGHCLLRLFLDDSDLGVPDFLGHSHGGTQPWLPIIATRADGGMIGFQCWNDPYPYMGLFSTKELHLWSCSHRSIFGLHAFVIEQSPHSRVGQGPQHPGCPHPINETTSQAVGMFTHLCPSPCGVVVLPHDHTGQLVSPKCRNEVRLEESS